MPYEVFIADMLVFAYILFALVGVLLVVNFFINKMAKKEEIAVQAENAGWLKKHGVRSRKRRHIYADYFKITDNLPVRVNPINWEEGEISLSVHIDGRWINVSYGTGDIDFKVRENQKPTVTFLYSDGLLDEDFNEGWDLIEDAVSGYEPLDLIRHRYKKVVLTLNQQDFDKVTKSIVK